MTYHLDKVAYFLAGGLIAFYIGWSEGHATESLIVIFGVAIISLLMSRNNAH